MMALRNTAAVKGLFALMAVIALFAIGLFGITMLMGGAADSSCTSGTTGGGVNPAQASQNEPYLWNWFTGKGFTPVATAGAMGNMEQENGFSTADNSGGMGIVQWIGDRRLAEIAMAMKDGLSPTSLAAQENYLWAELTDAPGAAGDYRAAARAVQAARTPADAAFAWEINFEHASTPVMTNRINYANQIYATYSGKGAAPIYAGLGLGQACGASGVAQGGFANPFPGGWKPDRLDMGYDGTFTGQIVAPFSGTITYAGVFKGWLGSYGVIIRADGNVGLPTHSLYFTEGVSPVVHSGQHVAAGTPIALAVASPYGDSYGFGALGAIEWGVSQDGSLGQQADAYAVALGNGSPAARQMVLNFAQWAEQTLGMAAPKTTDHAGAA